MGMTRKTEIMMRSKLLAISVIATVLSVSSTMAFAECHVDINQNGTKIQVCDGGVSIGGDIKDVTPEHPLGGPNAIIPKAREDILRGLGMAGENNDVAKWLRNPGGQLRCAFFGC